MRASRTWPSRSVCGGIPRRSGYSMARRGARSPVEMRTRTCLVPRATGDEDERADDGVAWTPFSLPEAEPSTSVRAQRMIETRKGDPYVEVPTPTPTSGSGSVSSSEEAEEACSHCGGTGKQVCAYCKGSGRTNYTDRVMLPKGVFPTWCTKCIRCSGETVCGWCLGSGKAREPIGFRVR